MISVLLRGWRVWGGEREDKQKIKSSTSHLVSRNLQPHVLLSVKEFIKSSEHRLYCLGSALAREEESELGQGHASLAGEWTRPWFPVPGLTCFVWSATAQPAEHYHHLWPETRKKAQRPETNNGAQRRGPRDVLGAGGASTGQEEDSSKTAWTWQTDVCLEQRR